MAQLVGDVELLHQYQVVFEEESDKHAVTLGKVSAAAMYTQITEKPAQTCIDAYTQAEEDPRIVCDGLCQTVAEFKMK